MGFPDCSFGKEFTCKAGDTGSVPGWGRSAGEAIGYALQYSGLDGMVHDGMVIYMDGWTSRRIQRRPRL